ncbi:MAG TPA: TIGR03067 domain-containing protein [Planctomycetaceae bacterium]|jgi:uncharacterized protein (TIGR03067 family)|nr:TIGR03067 domain-containing protein [Planctomycetaceae bacterium]
MCRMLAAILLVGSSCAFAQGPRVAEDQKQLQGIWRVREVVGPAAVKAAMLQMELVFVGKTLLPLAAGEPSSEMSYSLDPAKNPKQIDLHAMPQLLANGQAVPPPQPGIYAFEQDRLKLRFAQEQDRRPADFSVRRDSPAGDCVIILERDTSPAARTKIRDARAILAIRELGGTTFSGGAQPGPPPTLNVKLDESNGDAHLAKMAQQLKNLSAVHGLFLCRSKVTDAGLASLDGINNISHIDLEATAITDAGLEHLRNMTRLNSLIVTDTKVTAAAVSRLKQSLPQLRVTHFSRAESVSQLAITNAGGTQSSDASERLVEIRFARKLSDFQLLGLQKHLELWKTSLRSIDLTGSEITDRGLEALSGLTSLEQLNLKGTDVTVAGVKSLKRTVPNLKVKH